MTIALRWWCRPCARIGDSASTSKERTATADLPPSQLTARFSRPRARAARSPGCRTESQELPRDVRRRDGSRLSGRVVRRADLDDVAAGEADPAQDAQECDALRGREPAHLGRARPGRVCRVEEVDVEGDEREPIADPPADRFREPLGSARAELVARD